MISVVIPTFNRHPEVSAAVGSVLSQEQAEFEVIVVDDGSSDRTVASLAGLADPRLRVVVQTHLGRCIARNTGAVHARGQYLVFLDSDDVARPGWLAALASLVSAGDRLASCAVRFCQDESDRVVAPQPIGEEGRFLPLFLAGAFIVNRQAFFEAGGYDAALEHSENTDLGLRLYRVLARSDWPASQDALVEVTERTGPVDPAVRYETALRMIEKHRDLWVASRRWRASYEATAGDAAWRLGRAREARRHFATAWRAEPMGPRHAARFARSLFSRSRG